VRFYKSEVGNLTVERSRFCHWKSRKQWYYSKPLLHCNTIVFVIFCDKAGLFPKPTSFTVWILWL
jgi:hypothetical protein